MLTRLYITAFCVILLSCNKANECDSGCYTNQIMINGHRMDFTKAYTDTDYPYLICDASYIIHPSQTDSLVLTFTNNVRFKSGEILWFSLLIKTAYVDTRLEIIDSVLQYSFKDTGTQKNYITTLQGRLIPSFPPVVNGEGGILVTYVDKEGRHWSTANFNVTNPTIDIATDARYDFSLSNITYQPVIQQQLNRSLDGFILNFDVKAFLYDSVGNGLNFYGNVELPFCVSYQ